MSLPSHLLEDTNLASLLTGGEHYPKSNISLPIKASLVLTLSNPDTNVSLYEWKFGMLKTSVDILITHNPTR